MNIYELKLNNNTFTVACEHTSDLSFIKFHKISFCGIDFDPKNFRQYDILRLEREIYRKFFKKPLTESNT